MAISFSPRVRRNLAQQMSFSHRWTASSPNRYSVQCLMLISNQVSVPTNPSQLLPYLKSCLNNSGNDGSTADENNVNVLAYRFFSGTEASALNQSGTLFSSTAAWTMTVNAAGTIGSAIMFTPTWSTNGMSLSNNVGGAANTFASTQPLDINTATGSGGIMLSKAMTQVNYDLYAPEYYSSFNFITDSIATSGTPFVKVSSMSTTVGQSFTVNSIKIRINNFNT